MSEVIAGIRIPDSKLVRDATDLHKRPEIALVTGRPDLQSSMGQPGGCMEQSTADHPTTPLRSGGNASTHANAAGGRWNARPMRYGSGPVVPSLAGFVGPLVGVKLSSGGATRRLISGGGGMLLMMGMGP